MSFGLRAIVGAAPGIFFVGAMTACGPEASPVAPQAPPPAEAQGETLLIEEPVSELMVSDQGVRLSFPGTRHFVREEGVGSWTTFRHARTGARLSIRHRPSRRTVTPKECEQEAGRSLRLLRDPVTETLSEGAFRTRDYFGTSVVGLAADRSGRVVVHAAGLARCLSLVFWDPRGGEAAWAMELVSERFLPTVRALSVDERAPARERL